MYKMVIIRTGTYLYYIQSYNLRKFGLMFIYSVIYFEKVWTEVHISYNLQKKKKKKKKTEYFFENDKVASQYTFFLVPHCDAI